MSERDPWAAPVRRRVTAAIAAVSFSFGAISCANETKPYEQPTSASTPDEMCVYNDDGEHITISLTEVQRCLGALATTEGAFVDGYSRTAFGGWRTKNGCSTREIILIRDLEDEVVDPKTCKIISGTFDDRYTKENENQYVTEGTVSKLQIDHVVSLSNAWQSGASTLPPERRRDLANNPLNLQTTSGRNNQEKSDDDASKWVPEGQEEACDYVARQVLVKSEYDLSVKSDERAKINEVLQTSCPTDQLITVPEAGR